MAATVFWYGPRIVLASLGARELLVAEAPLLHSTVERLAQAAGVERPKLYLLPDGHPRALAVGRGASASGLALSQGLVSLVSPAELEGVDRTRARARPAPGRRRADARRPGRRLARRGEQGRRLPGALAPRRPRPRRGELRAAAPLAAPRVRGGRIRGAGLRLAARPGRRAHPPRAGAGARRASRRAR